MRIRKETADRLRENFVVYALLTVVLLAPIPALWAIGDHDALAIVAGLVYGWFAGKVFMGVVVRGDWY